MAATAYDAATLVLQDAGVTLNFPDATMVRLAGAHIEEAGGAQCMVTVAATVPTRSDTTTVRLGKESIAEGQAVWGRKASARTYQREDRSTSSLVVVASSPPPPPKLRIGSRG